MKKKEKSPLLTFKNNNKSGTWYVLLVCIALFCVNLNVSAQGNITVNGQVLDEAGDPLIGVAVQELNTMNGSMTDLDGKYSIKNLSSNSTLKFTYVGFIGEEVKVGSRTEINMTLRQDLQVLDEVVVVGYGTQKKQTLTGAVSAITSDQLLTTKNDNIDNMITGKIPGVRVIQKTGEPGEYNTVFQIRGMGNPLFIVDGVPRDNMNRLDPSEVESISVLKDGSAAIYGVRAANGVVLVTTKRGKTGKPKLEYSGSYGWQKATDLPKTLNAVEFMTLSNENALNKGESLRYSDADFEPYLNGTKQSTDWTKVGMRETAPQTQHNLNVRGGSDNVSYFISLGYLKQDGFWKSGDLNHERFNIRSNVDVQVTKQLKLSMLIGGFKANKNMPYRDVWTVYKSMWTQVPLWPVYANDNPDYLYNAADGDNLIAATSKDIGGYKSRKEKSLQTTFSLEYAILDGLKARAMYSYDYWNRNYKEVRKSYNQYTYNPETEEYTAHVAHSPSRVRRDFYEKPGTLMNLGLTYEKTFANKHNINLLALYEESRKTADNFWARRDLTLDSVDQLFAGEVADQMVGMSTDKDNWFYDVANKAWIGRVNYDYDSKYLVEFAFRYDGSSKFIKNDRWGFFPSTSVGWRATEESFFKNTEALSFINNLKPRLSYGVMGDDTAIDYQFLPGYNYPDNGYVFGGEWTNALVSRGLSNPFLTWSKAKTTNIGLDIGLWRGLLSIEADYFIRKRTGLYSTRAQSLPGTVGAGLPQENLNSDRTSGFELAVSHKNRISDFNYFIDANVSYTRTKFLYREQGEFGNSYEYWRKNENNRWNDIWWGYGYSGQFNSYDNIYNAPIYDGKGNSILRPGDYIYEDWNGDGVIDDWDKKPIAYRTANDQSYPHINFGFTIGADYKGFDVVALFQGAARSNTKYPEQLEKPLHWDRNGLAMFMDRWHRADPTNPNSDWIAGYYPSTNTGESKNYEDSERSVQDAKYLRLKNLEFGYTLPKKLLTNWGIESVRVYFSGYNLITWTSIMHVDPERPSETYGYMYPLTKNYNFGINISF